MRRIAMLSPSSSRVLLPVLCLCYVVLAGAQGQLANRTNGTFGGFNISNATRGLIGDIIINQNNQCNYAGKSWMALPITCPYLVSLTQLDPFSIILLSYQSSQVLVPHRCLSVSCETTGIMTLYKYSCCGKVVIDLPKSVVCSQSGPYA